MSKVSDARYSKSLARSFQWYFVAALILPLFAFIRIAYDSYIQEIALNQRRLIDRQRSLGKSLDQEYLNYRRVVKKIGIAFSGDSSLQKLPGVRDPDLWFGGRKNFLRSLEKEEYSKDRRKLLLSYSRQKRRYKKYVWEALYSNATGFDEWKSPLKAQVNVWERGHLQSRGMPWEDPGIHDFVPDLERMDMAPFIREIRYGDMVGRLPMHQIFYTGNSIMSQVWHNLEKTSRELILAEMFGKEYVPAGDLANIERASKASLSEHRGAFLPFRLPGFIVELYWDTLPVSFDPKKFFKNQQKAPDGIYFLIFDHRKSEAHFLEMLRGMHTTKALDSVVQGITQWKSQLKDQGIGFFAINLNRLDQKGALPGTYITLGFDPLKGFRVPDDQNQASFLNHPWTVGERTPLIHSIIGVLDEKSGMTTLEGSSLKEFIERYGEKPGEGPVSDSEIQDLRSIVGISKSLNKALSFAYSHPDGEEMIGTVFPSSVFPSRAFVFLQSQEGFLAQIMRKQFLYLGFLLFVILGIGVLGRFLSRQVVEPIVKLCGYITQLAEGQQVKFADISRNDEIGDLGREFQQMAHRIQEKLFEMRAIGAVNLLMTHDFSKALMLRYILHLVCIRYGADYGVIGFFENRLSEIPGDYETWNRNLDSSQGAPSILPSVIKAQLEAGKGVEYLGREQLESMGLDSEFGIVCRLSPEEGEQALIHGFLLMAGMDQNPRSVFPDPYHNSLVHLSSQAKLAVVKSLLDEIQSDARRGKEIQEGLMPAASSGIGGPLEVGHYFHGARGLAGDFFDYLSFEDENLVGFVIADVSGKGVGPSLFGATAKAYLKVLSKDSPDDPGKALTKLNDLLSSNQSSLFLTLFFLVIDLSRMEMVFASAGHNDMFLFTAGNQLNTLKARGLPLGMLDDQDYETRKIGISPGDSLVLYTDGIPELENPARELFGMKRFEDFCLRNLSSDADTWVSALEQELNQFRRGVNPSDDVTALRIQIPSNLGPTRKDEHEV